MVYNLTQHTATADQINAGVVEVPEELREALLGALNFESLPTNQEVYSSAQTIGRIMEVLNPDFGEIQFMVGGAPYLMAALVTFAPCYDMVFAYSDRVSEEVHMPNGSVQKVTSFKHVGFVPMLSTMM